MLESEEGINRQYDTRREQFEDETLAPLSMPECIAQHLIEHLYEIGPTSGEYPITHGEIQAWMNNTGHVLSPWEAKTLRRLSVDYINQSAISAKHDTPAPWTDAPYLRVTPNLAARRMQQAMLELAKM